MSATMTKPMDEAKLHEFVMKAVRRPGATQSFAEAPVTTSENNVVASSY
jgi:hypothetical protein